MKFPRPQLSLTIVRFLPIVCRHMLNGFHVCLGFLLVLFHLHWGLYLTYLWGINVTVKFAVKKNKHALLMKIKHFCPLKPRHTNKKWQWGFKKKKTWYMIEHNWLKKHSWLLCLITTTTIRFRFSQCWQQLLTHTFSVLIGGANLETTSVTLISSWATATGCPLDWFFWGREANIR